MKPPKPLIKPTNGHPIHIDQIPDFVLAYCQAVSHFLHGQHPISQVFVCITHGQLF
jgi:hypothetical protein